MKKLTKIRTSFLIIALLMSFAAIAAEKNETTINGNPIENPIKKAEFEPQQIHQADPCFYINNTSCYSNNLENGSYLIIGNKRNNDNIKGSAIFSSSKENGKDDAEITANYEADPMIGSAPLNVNFTDLSFAQNTIINSWEWDFNNDGVIDSQLQNPEFLFINPGIYNVSLTVSDGNINDSKFGIINVVDVDTTFSFIPFSGLEEDYAGGAAWNTDGFGPEPPAIGHFLPPPASISIAYYYLASRDYDNIDPLSSAGLFGNGPSSGFPNFEAALALHGKTIQDINISYGLMSLGNDIEGIDWWMVGDVETRIYRGGTYQFKLNDENLITGDMPDYTQTIVYKAWMGEVDEISGVTGESHPVNNSAGRSPEAQEIAQALMDDIGDDPIRFIFTSTQPSDQFEFVGNGRSGGFFENHQGFIIKASPIECELEVECGEDRFIGSGETVNLEALATDGTEPYTYLWEPADFLDDPAISNPEATPDETTTYTCTVTDFEDCVAIASVTIYVDTCDYWFDGLDYTMSFENVETDRENWTAIDFNPFENEWELYENAADAHTGDYSYKFDYLSTFANDWLFSRCFNLEDNHSYEISFWYKTDSEGDFQLDLRLCTELDSLGEFIHWENDPALAYTQIIDTVTIGSDGIYYFAWQTIFWGDNIVYVDDINISDLGIGCTLEVDCGEGQFINSGETAYLEALATDGTEPYTYLWEPTDFLDDPAISNPEATPDETTTYTCTVTDFEDCVAIASVTIYVDTCDYWFDGLDYTMSFENVETDRENWTAIDFNPFENEWELYENAADAHTGDYSYKFDYLSTFANDWIFSRCFNLEDNHSYEISFWYKTDSEGDFQLDLRLCTELDSLGEFIHRESDAALAYTQIIDTVTIGSDGIYYFAWQTIFWGDNIVYIDDINISDLGIIEEIPFPLPFAEFWDSNDFDFNGWTREAANWRVTTASGYPPPCVVFGMYPYQTNYEFDLVSHEFDGRDASQIELSFDLSLSNFGNTLEQMSIDVFNGIEWTQIENLTNEDDDIPLTNFSYNISDYAVGNIFKIRFVAHGEDSYYIGSWKIDNIIIEETAISQNIILNTGYQFVSSFLEFDDPNMQNVLTEILPNLDFVRNSGGFMLRKIGPNWINGIGDWVNTEGYLFKMLNPDEIEFEGMVTDIQTPIDLVTGYQIISFLSSEPMDASLAFESIIGDNLDFVRNSGGFMLRKIGPVWINSIGDINPGEGLLVKMLNPDTQIYPEIISKSTSDKVFIEPQKFNFEGGNPSEAVYTLYVSGLNIGDEIGVFDGENLVGANTIVSDNVFENSIPVFSVLTNGQGYTKGNKISIKIWDSQKQVFVLSDYTFNKEYVNAYSQNIFPENDGEFSILNITKSDFSLKNNNTANINFYPNPATDVLNIISDQTIKNVRIINFTGQIIFDNNFNNTDITIDASVFQSGLYIIRVETSEGVKTGKVTIK